MTLGKLGDRLWITPATVTNAIDRLEAAGLCRRVDHPQDARATLAEITAKGRRMFDRSVEALNVKLFGAVGLTPESWTNSSGSSARSAPAPAISSASPVGTSFSWRHIDCAGYLAISVEGLLS